MSKTTTDEVFRGCLESLIRCVRDASNPRANEVMKSEIRNIARKVSLWELSGEEKARVFLRPMEVELVRRYGSHFGRRLYWDFFDAFWLQSWSRTSLDRPEQGRSLEASPGLTAPTCSG
jgi:hypothetical protein